MVVQWLVDKITFPSPPPSYSLTSHPELFFIKNTKKGVSHPGVPCMLYAIPQGAPVLLVHAHSNGCDIGDMRQTLQSISESLRVHVMSFEYPGYGLHVGSSSKKSIDETAKKVLTFITDELQINLAQVVWYGRSIGSGPATGIVHRITKELQVQPGGLVLQCGFAKFPEVAGHLFGRMAKRVVSTLWPNEAMVKELNCPVLVLHGRNDTMIPIEQSEKLWKAVNMKDMSKFLPCDCGHNDFNFRQCTLRPLYEFLSLIISQPNYPSSNFTIHIADSNRPHVHHIEPLRDKLCVYSFRRPDLDMWIRSLLQEVIVLSEAPIGKAEEKDLTPTSSFRPGQHVKICDMKNRPDLNGCLAQLMSPGSPGDTRTWRLRLIHSSEELVVDKSLIQPTAPAAVMDKPKGESKSNTLFSSEGKPQGAHGSRPRPSQYSASSTAVNAPRPSEMSSPSAPPPKQQEKPKAKGPVEPPPIPDLSGFPAVEDPAEALFNARGMTRTCAMRTSAFLERLQAQLDMVEDLEHKPMEEIVDIVESEFWACDPLLTVWEEVYLPKGDRVRLRVGPFSVDNYGNRSYEPAAVDNPDFLRVPLWTFCPTVAQFRCLAEWSLLTSKRLEKSFPAQKHKGGGCAPCRRKKAAPRARGNQPLLPTRGVLSTCFAAHFVNWVVEKTDEAQNIFAKFVNLYQQPDSALRKIPPGMISAEFAAYGGFKADEKGPTWSPAYFSAAARSLLRDGVPPGPNVSEFYSHVWSALPDGEPPVIDEFLPGNEVPVIHTQAAREGNADWLVATAFRTFETRCPAAPATPGGAFQPVGDPLHQDARKARADSPYFTASSPRVMRRWFFLWACSWMAVQGISSPPGPSAPQADHSVVGEAAFASPRQSPPLPKSRRRLVRSEEPSVFAEQLEGEEHPGGDQNKEEEKGDSNESSATSDAADDGGNAGGTMKGPKGCPDGQLSCGPPGPPGAPGADGPSADVKNSTVVKEMRAKGVKKSYVFGLIGFQLAIFGVAVIHFKTKVAKMRYAAIAAAHKLECADQAVADHLGLEHHPGSGGDERPHAVDPGPPQPNVWPDHPELQEEFEESEQPEQPEQPQQPAIAEGAA